MVARPLAALIFIVCQDTFRNIMRPFIELHGSSGLPHILMPMRGRNAGYVPISNTLSLNLREKKRNSLSEIFVSCVTGGRY